MKDYYKDWDVEQILSDVLEDAYAIRRIIDDISGDIQEDDELRLHAVMKLAEDQMLMISKAVELLNT